MKILRKNMMKDERDRKKKGLNGIKSYRDDIDIVVSLKPLKKTEWAYFNTHIPPLFLLFLLKISLFSTCVNNHL